MPSYFLALIDIHDEAGYQEYLAGFDDIFGKYKGRVIAVEDQPRILEGRWPAKRTVLMEFPDDAELRRWYESREYQDLARLRQKSSVANIAVITGRE